MTMSVQSQFQVQLLQPLGFEIFSRFLSAVQNTINYAGFARGVAGASYVTNLISSVNEVLGFPADTWDRLNSTENNNETSTRKVGLLFDAVRASIQLSPSQIKPFLEFLINTERHGLLAQRVRDILTRDFSGFVCIAELPIESFQSATLLNTPLIPSAQNNGNDIGRRKLTMRTTRILTLLAVLCCTIMVTALAATSIPKFFHDGNFLNDQSTQHTPLNSHIEKGMMMSPSHEIGKSSTHLRESFVEVPPIMQQPEMSTGSTLTNTISSTDISKAIVVTAQPRKRLPKFTFEESSYDAIERFLCTAPEGRHLGIKVNLRSPREWPDDAKLTHPEKINRLSLQGPFYSNRILQILNQTTNSEMLNVNNAGDELCSINQGQTALFVGMKKVVLPELRVLVLEGFTTCKELFNALAEKLRTPRLEGMKIEGGAVNPQNYKTIQDLLQGSRGTMTHFSLRKTTIDMGSSKRVLFNSTELGTHPKMESLYMDFIPDKQSRVTFLGRDVCKVFPNLTSLASLRGNLPWSQVPHIFLCMRLKKLKITIELKSERSYFDVSFLQQNLTNLEEVRIALYHRSCENVNSKEKLVLLVNGTETLISKLAKLQILSNCKLRISNGSILAGLGRHETYFVNKRLHGVELDLIDA